MAEKKSWYEDREEFAELMTHTRAASTAVVKLVGAYVKEHPNEPGAIVAKHVMGAVAEIGAAKLVSPGKKPVSVAEQLVLAESVLAPDVIAKIREQVTQSDGTLRDDEMTRSILNLVIKANIAANKKGKP